MIEQLWRAGVRDGRADHAAGADRRVRRDGVHGRPLRHRIAGLARRADGRRLSHLRAVRGDRARQRRCGCAASAWSGSCATSAKRSCWCSGTSSSESALPRLMVKMERLGCSKPVVGLVVPAGYSFNLDGTAIYMSMAAIFVAQASGVDLSLREQLSILGDPDADVERRRRRHRQRLHHARGDASRRSRPSRPPRWRCSSASIASCRRCARSPT